MLRIQQPTEESLIALCKKKSAKAQKEMYNQLAPKMLGVCNRYIRDREESEHVMIGAFVKVFDKIEQYSGDGSFAGWVRRVVVNECLMYLRKNKSDTLQLALDESETHPAMVVCEESHEVADLLALIKELPVGYRAVFNLYAIEGYSHKEIGAQLDISENTSKSQLSRARKWLQERLKMTDLQPIKYETDG